MTAPSIVMLPGLGPTALEDLAAALEAGRLRAPFTRSAARRQVPEALLDEVLHADAMDARPELRVRIFANVERKDGPKYAQLEAADWVNRFRSHFSNKLWPGKRLPELYYDPRSLAPDPGERAILHAKCVVIDDTQVFLTSANFTQAGQQRNLEAGLRLEHPALARDLTAQFDALVQTGALLPIHPHHR
jgi:phosphatidylserine/phosphatidylglycerophosphate/cardiolipin synthase-like enzyme